MGTTVKNAIVLTMPQRIRMIISMKRTCSYLSGGKSSSEYSINSPRVIRSPPLMRAR